LGTTLPVLWESANLVEDKWVMKGLTGNYLKVTATAPVSLWNRITEAHLVQVTMDGLQGEIISSRE